MTDDSFKKLPKTYPRRVSTSLLNWNTIKCVHFLHHDDSQTRPTMSTRILQASLTVLPWKMRRLSFEYCDRRIESSIPHYDSEQKKQNAEYRHTCCHKLKNVLKNLLLIMYWNAHRAYVINFLERRATLNSFQYILSLNHLRRKICRLVRPHPRATRKMLGTYCNDILYATPSLGWIILCTCTSELQLFVV